MGELFKSTKFKSTLAGAVIMLLVMILPALLAKVGIVVDEGTISQVLWTVAGLFGVQIGGQALSEFGSGGLTSGSSGEAVAGVRKAEAEALKNVSTPSAPVATG